MEIGESLTARDAEEQKEPGLHYRKQPNSNGATIMAVKGTIEITGRVCAIEWKLHVFTPGGKRTACTVESRWSYTKRQSAMAAAKRQAKRLGIDVSGQGE